MKWFCAACLSAWLLAACRNKDGDSYEADGGIATRDSGIIAATTDTGVSETTVHPAPDFKMPMDKMRHDMRLMSMTGNADYDFAAMMKRHHEAGVEMAMLELAAGKNEELKALAQKIISDARKDSAELAAFLQQYKPEGRSGFAEKAMDIMMKDTSGASMDGQSAGPDPLFAAVMAMHHRQAIGMSREYLKHAKEAQPKKVANNTIKSNSEDLKALESWLKSHKKSEKDTASRKNPSPAQ